jgi:hypothetical protein
MVARLRPYVLLFMGLNVVYHANLRPIDSSDSLGAALIPFAVVLDHQITLDRFEPWMRGHLWFAPAVIRDAHGHAFSSYPIGAPLLVSPLYLPLASMVRGWDPGSLVILARITAKFAASAIAALSAVLLLLLLKRITTTGWAWCLTLEYALATETWSISSQAMWQHGPGELAIIGSFYALERWSEDRARNGWLWICGASTAMAFMIRPTNLVLMPAILLALLLVRTKFLEFLRFLALPILGGALLTSYNFYVFDRISGGYATDLLKGSAYEGLAGIFLSPGRGLLWYTPVAMFALFAFSRRAAGARRQHRPIFVTAVAFIGCYAVSICRSTSWWGGYSWGPRLLTEIVPPLIVLMALGVSVIDRAWLRSACVALSLYSVLIQGIGVFLYPNGRWDGTPEPIDKSPGRLWAWADNPIARTVSGGLYWQPYAIAGAALTGGLPAAQRRMRELNINPIEQAEPGRVSNANPGLP